MTPNWILNGVPENEQRRVAVTKKNGVKDRDSSHRYSDVVRGHGVQTASSRKPSPDLRCNTKTKEKTERERRKKNNLTPVF